MIGAIQDPATQAWAAGFIACLFSAMPLAMLLLLPHDGWGRHLPSNTYTKMSREIRRLKQKVFELEVEVKLLHEIKR
jgi:hypothetical protein